MAEQRVLTFVEIGKLCRERTAIWITPSVNARVKSTLEHPTSPELQPLPAGIESLIVIGGGALIDKTKVWRVEQRPDLRLIAIPSIWGSGAEASPIAVLNRGEKKDIQNAPELLPDARAIWPDLAITIPADRATYGYGDCWSHALEGFLSPLAARELRIQVAALLRRLLETPMQKDPVWFELSAHACAAQARSSVGLVHGIAHTLEGTLQKADPAASWYHSKLCSVFLWPVMRFNEEASDKLRTSLAEHGVDGDKVMATVRTLFDEPTYDRTMPFLKQYWMDILRDASSRTNSTLVRPASLEYFLGKRFL